MDTSFTAPQGSDTFVAALCPSYWSHVPLFIKSVQNCVIMGAQCCGVACLIQKGKILPFSRCSLVGIVVAIDRKYGGVHVYTIDDGTGLIDCVHYVDHGEFQLLGLLKDDPDDDVFMGDTVKVFGRVEVVSVKSDAVEVSIGDSVQPARRCTFEIHVFRMQNLSDSFGKRQTNGLEELKHFSECFSASVSAPSPIDVLEWLGPEIKRQVLNRHEMPSADDELGRWKVFGVKCMCDLPYMEELLYCHCQASLSKLDPNFRFRDDFLQLLLAIQDEQLGNERPICFQYSVLRLSNRVRSLALEQQGDKYDAAWNQLFSATFQALRQDGVTYLLDKTSDIYMLITRSRVLEPYIKSTMQRDEFGRSARVIEQPNYIRAVPKRRLQYTQRLLREQM